MSTLGAQFSDFKSFLNNDLLYSLRFSKPSARGGNLGYQSGGNWHSGLQECLVVCLFALIVCKELLWKGLEEIFHPLKSFNYLLFLYKMKLFNITYIYLPGLL